MIPTIWWHQKVFSKKNFVVYFEITDESGRIRTRTQMSRIRNTAANQIRNIRTPKNINSYLENVVDPEDHLCSLAGLVQHVRLHVEALRDAHERHVAYGALVHVQAHGGPAGGVQGSQLGDELGWVVAAVLGDDGGQLAQGVGERLHGVRFLA